MPMTLRWRAATSVPVEGDVLRPETLTPLSSTEASKLPVLAGQESLELGELFHVDGDGRDGHLVLEGDLRQVRGIGQGMRTGRLTVLGEAGARLGAEMMGGTIEVEGSVGDWAAAEMRGGLLRIRGRAGQSLGSAYPGNRSGMREGVILVEGSIGDDAGLAMRRGLIAVSGPAGDGLGRSMIAGSIFAFGPVGLRAGSGMKRGTLALFGVSDPVLLPTFAPSGPYRPPFLTIYLRRLKQWGFPVPEPTFVGAPERYNGDLVERGKGEVLVWS